MSTYFGSDTWFPLTKVFQATRASPTASPIGTRFPFISPGAIDGAVSIQQRAGGYSLSLTGDQFPSWEFLRIPHYNATGNTETHIFGTRGQKVRTTAVEAAVRAPSGSMPRR